MRLTSGHGGHGVARAGEFLTIGALGCSVALLAVLTVSRPDLPDRRRRRRKAAAQASENSESAEEWLSPLRGLDVRPASAQRHLPAEPEPVQVQQADAAWPSYPDQGAYPGPGAWGVPPQGNWADGPYDRDRADWSGSGDEWDGGYASGPPEVAAGPDLPAWPDAYPQVPNPGAWAPETRGEVPSPGAWAPEPAGGPQAGYQQAEYLNAPLPGYLPAPPVGALDAGYAQAADRSRPDVDGPWAGGPYGIDPLAAPPAEADGAWATGPQDLVLAEPDLPFAGTFPAAGPQAVLPAAPGAPWAAIPQAMDPQSPELGGTGEEDDTSPLPVIISRGMPPPDHQDEPGSFAEPTPAWEPSPARAPASIWLPPIDQEPVPDWEPPPGLEPAQQWEFPGDVSLDHGPATGSGPPAAGAYPAVSAVSPSGPAQEKMEQIKELYLTAEAIGEDALTKHFELLSQRQRDLIREFFEEAGLGSGGSEKPGGDSAPDGAPLAG